MSTNMEKRGKWTANEIKTLKRLFPNLSTAHVAVVLGRPLEAVKKEASRLGLRKSRKRLRSLGRRD